MLLADWYLNQTQPHQWLFLDLVGPLLRQLGIGWLVLVVVLAGWCLLGAWLARGAVRRLPGHQAHASRELWIGSALALVPFDVRLLVTLLEADGVLLQLYPFRWADTLVPLMLVISKARTP